MEYQVECLSTLAHLLDLPDGALHADLALLTDPEIATPEIATHVALFAEGVADLSLEERQEFFAKTFVDPASSGNRQTVVAALRSGDSEAVAVSLAALDRLCRALSKDRNPYLHLCMAARALLVVT